MIYLKLLTFALALFIGVAVSAVVRYETTSFKQDIEAARKPVSHIGHPYLSDGSAQSDQGRSSSAPASTEPIRSQSALKILSKKKAEYTEVARTNGTQGTVTLRVTFLASGSIGGISVIKSLPDGLTDQAIAAARMITFEPERVNGTPRTTSRPVTFSFNLY